LVALGRLAQEKMNDDEFDFRTIDLETRYIKREDMNGIAENIIFFNECFLTIIPKMSNNGSRITFSLQNIPNK
jgi:hypothetical protein